jgi:hypothetical protein
MISAAYRQEQESLHENDNYGTASVVYARHVSSILNKYHITDILDYGAGKGRLSESLSLDHQANVSRYDPAVKKWAKTPDPHEFVACIDVLEHIEPEYLEDVLDDLKRVTRRMGFFSIHMGPAKKTLSDGRNAHLIIKPLDWWLPKIMERFSLTLLSRTKDDVFVVVEA